MKSRALPYEALRELMSDFSASFDILKAAETNGLLTPKQRMTVRRAFEYTLQSHLRFQLKDPFVEPLCKEFRFTALLKRVQDRQRFNETQARLKARQ